MDAKPEGVEVLGPKGPEGRYGGTDLTTWARHQLGIAKEILDNPGGGLLFATQAIGQVRAAFSEAMPERRELTSALEQAEQHVVYREFAQARTWLGRALGAM
jgi:hypothetical protein